MGWFRADGQACEAFDRQGFWLQPALLSPPEIEALRKYAKQDQQLASRATSRSDAQGGTTTLALENTLGTDPYSSVARARRIVEPMKRFLGDEVYHYHHKMMLKEPRVGGAWEWHQDYGYWYNFGCLFPTMASCYVAIDQATKENGCLQIIDGSHAMGRIEHGKVGGQTGADPERMEAILARFPVRYVEMQPGDALFFHGNLLHRSDQNTSEHPRWALISCYNTKSNNPYKPSRHPFYEPLDVLDDDQLLDKLTDSNSPSQA